MIKLLFILSLAILFTSCSSSKINIADYSQNINQKLPVDPICKKYYITKKPTVAVVNFTNNTNFDLSTQNDRSSNSYGGVYGIGIGVKSSKSNTKRQVNPKLSSAFIPKIEQMVLNIKGAKLITRSDLNKVDTELKLQDSGLLDPNSVVEFGLNSGVQYIITGSIDYISHNFQNYSQYTGSLAHASLYTNNKDLKLASAAVFLTSSFFDGTTIKSAVTVKIIDVSTGEIIFSKQIKTKDKIHNQKKPSYDQLVGLIKKSINKALPTLQSKLKEQFSKTSYISQIKKIPNDNEAIVKITLGKDDDIKQDDNFMVQTLEISIDPLTNKKTCEKIDTNIKLTTTNQINQTTSWAKVIDGDYKKIKLLQLVKKIKD